MWRKFWAVGAGKSEKWKLFSRKFRRSEAESCGLLGPKDTEKTVETCAFERNTNKTTGSRHDRVVVLLMVQLVMLLLLQTLLVLFLLLQ